MAADENENLFQSILAMSEEIENLIERNRMVPLILKTQWSHR